ncbi:nitrogen permease regulator of amino acid transport activity 3-domain-containing protein [Lipomyces tetrasporus]|uniref:Nitrogen permease regulator 3 n=1 Tax=Lipomyces tetrasporus TaxID=54092 RepID=A0AAD7VV10_9ASCO|nr:nitrogen permease regulator of amino acid transport activity 3-domain-containing protein [Lipomyces tetrasporus]KAJ8101785.1 nitrogen permease regulator of amino acid transport activity 3-domain-containing protein [Lipomyces tetrasporus]
MASISSAPSGSGISPHLLGIMLVITTPNGPQFVFNYPQTAYAASSRQAKSATSASTSLASGRRHKKRDGDGSPLPYSIPSSPALDAMPAPSSRLYRFDSPDTSPSSSGYNSSASYSTSSSGSENDNVGYLSSTGSEEIGVSDDDDADIDNSLDLERDGVEVAVGNGLRSRQWRSSSRPGSSGLSQILALGPGGDVLPGVRAGLSHQARHSHRRSRRRRKQVAGGGFLPLPRHRSRTPIDHSSTGRRTQLSNSLVLEDPPGRESALTPEPLQSLGSPSQLHRRGLSPSAAGASSPRLSALSTMDTSTITSSLKLDEITGSLRASNVAPSPRSVSKSRDPISRRRSLDSSHSNHHHHHQQHHHHDRRRKSNTENVVQTIIGSDDDERSGNAAQDRHSSSSIYQQPWEKSFGYDSEFLAALLCPKRSMCDTKFEFTVGDLAFLGLPMHIRQDGRWKRNAGDRVRKLRSGPGGSASVSGTIKSMTTESDRFDGVFGYEDEGDYADEEYFDDDMEAESSTNALERSFLSLTLESSQISGQHSEAIFEGMKEDRQREEMNRTISTVGDERNSLANNINNMFHAFQTQSANLAAAASDSHNEVSNDRSTNETSDTIPSDDQGDRSSSVEPSSINASRAPSVVQSPLLEDILQQPRKQSVSNEALSPMNMFHVVFAMNPPELEYNARIDEMYDYVASPLAKCLRYEQHKSNYVWKQAQMMIRLRERAAMNGTTQEELWAQTLTHSSLALALAQVYLAISTSSIANVVINGSTRLFQIPIQMHSATLPSILEPVTVPGFYLTTEDYSDRLGANGEDRQNGQAGMPFLEHALLLLDAADKIINELQTDPRSPFARFIRSVSPTETLLKVAASSELSLHDVESYARHLIYWRRARIIIPVHRRGIYIVAPTAPLLWSVTLFLDRYSSLTLSSLHSHSKLFAKEFPSLPSLPRMLEEISSQEPRPYGNIIPSHNMREKYLDALAWLLRLGYLAQLRTFIWLRISKDIKKSVAHDNRLRNARESSQNGDLVDDNNGYRYDNLLSDIDAKSQSQRDDVESPMNQASAEENQLEDTIILEPDRATVLERTWMDKIVAGQNESIVELFWRVAKYMNGKVAFEDVPGKEGIERREVRNLLASVNEHIIISRHW